MRETACQQMAARSGLADRAAPSATRSGYPIRPRRPVRSSRPHRSLPADQPAAVLQSPHVPPPPPGFRPRSFVICHFVICHLELAHYRPPLARPPHRKPRRPFDQNPRSRWTLAVRDRRPGGEPSHHTYYGHLAYGVEAAAQTYSGKSARALDLAECALLKAEETQDIIGGQREMQVRHVQQVQRDGVDPAIHTHLTATWARFASGLTTERREAFGPAARADVAGEAYWGLRQPIKRWTMSQT